jgi:hypothetical protein
MVKVSVNGHRVGQHLVEMARARTGDKRSKYLTGHYYRQNLGTNPMGIFAVSSSTHFAEHNFELGLF